MKKYICNLIFDLFCEIDNLTDIKYIDFGNIIQPGLWIKLGASVNIPVLKADKP